MVIYKVFVKSGDCVAGTAGKVGIALPIPVSGRRCRSIFSVTYFVRDTKDEHFVLEFLSYVVFKGVGLECYFGKSWKGPYDSLYSLAGGITVFSCPQMILDEEV